MSVIIPVYKDVKGIRDTLESLCGQDFPEKRYEIIVVNDGGDMSTADVARDYGAKVINEIPNKGSYNARNIGLSESSGEYIAFIDADIKASKDWLSLGYSLLKKYDYVGGKVKIDEACLNSMSHYYEYLIAFDNEKKMNEYHYVPTANLFVKRKLVVDLGGFDKGLMSGGDNEFGDRVFYSRKYIMHYSSDLEVVHPPRGKNDLLKKIIRTRMGTLTLSERYPERFPQYQITFLSIVKDALTPTFKVFCSRRKLRFTKRLPVFIWSMYFGCTIFFKLLRLKKYRC